MKQIKIELDPDIELFIQSKCKNKAQGDSYRAVLGKLLTFRREQSLTWQAINAQDILNFGKYLMSITLTPSFRAQVWSKTSAFFYWLNENGKLKYPLDQIFLGWSFKARRKLEVNLPTLALKYLKETGNQVAEGTLKSHRAALKHLYIYAKKRNISVVKFERSDFVGLNKYLLTFNLSHDTRSNILIRCRAYFNWLYDSNIILSDPSSLIKQSDLPKIPKYLPRPIPYEIDCKLQRLWENSEDIFPLALLLLRKTGMRIGELLSLTRDCTKSDQNGYLTLLVPVGKTNSERIIPIDLVTMKIIERIQDIHNKPDQVLSKFLIIQKNGNTLNQCALNEVLRESLRSLGVYERYVCHQLRHTAATSLLNAGINIITLMEILGHKDLDMVLLYAQVTQGAINKEYAAASQKIFESFSVDQTRPSIDIHSQSSETLYELILTLKKKSKDRPHKNDRQWKNIIRRLSRIQEDILKFE
jgi:site-specific recombinase XerD